MPIDLLNFVRKWNASTLTERSAAQQHFRDLCEALDVPHPTQTDEIGANYTFEKRVRKVGSTDEGYADVWKRGYFAWEYKSKGGDLNKAYRQLNEYHEALDNPPLLVVCDFVRFEVHTKFENLPSRVYAFTLDDLLEPRDTATSALPPLEVLRHLFGDYNQLRPGVAAERVTKAAAADFLRLAQRIELEKQLSLEQYSRERIAHFLMRLVFCLFADSVGLLPNHTFRRLVETDRFSPLSFNRKLPDLFLAMSEQHGYFGVENIPYFNGGLFSDNSTIPLDHADLGILHSATHHDWSHVEPAIFGTLFERSLDAAKRSMIGAHYTSADDILLLIEPVLVAPLERRWQTVRQSVLDALAQETAAAEAKAKQPRLGLNRPALTLLQDWAAELSRVRVLDPACGSGNFLYLALKRLLDLWHQARVFGLAHGLTLALDPIPHPGQLFGIETDFYAHEIASVVVWIGFLQWKHDHGVKDAKEPLLQKLTNIEHADAILRYDSLQKSQDHPSGKPVEPSWPAADFIIGNPPFLGGNKIRSELKDAYIDDLFDIYRGRVEPFADIVCYWFEKARACIESGTTYRAGLLATQGIRGGANREVLARIKETGDIFFAESDRKWPLDGALVHVSMIGFDSGEEESTVLDGQAVEDINANLTSGIDTTSVPSLRENEGICFMGVSPKGAFDIDSTVARKMLDAPQNVNGRPNADVVKRVLSGIDITGNPRDMWTIDFGTDTSEAEAAKYELPFQYLRKHVYPVRQRNNREAYRKKWWLFAEPRPALRKAISQKRRYIATPATAKHRVFAWINVTTLCNQGTFVFARDDDSFFGIIQSTVHEVWARAQGTQLREVESGFRYTPVTTFDTFPFPWPPGTEPSEDADPRVKAIADAARELVRLRDEWLNPPGAAEDELKKRTLTNLYNARPNWLANSHRTLDKAVFAAYGWPANLTRDEILGRLLALNHQRSAAQSSAEGAIHNSPGRKAQGPASKESKG